MGDAAEFEQLRARAARFLPAAAGDDAADCSYGRVAVAGDEWLRERAGRYLRGGLPDLPLDDEGMVQALIVALGELDVELRAGWNPDKHPRGPGGRFRSVVDVLKEAIQRHRRGDGQGNDPFAGYDREQLRRVARARGIELARGESRESIAAKLLDHFGEPAATEPAGKGPASGPARLVELRPETHRAVAAAVAAMPASDDGWRDIVQDRRERIRITGMLGDARRAYTDAVRIRDANKNNWVKLAGHGDPRVDSWATLQKHRPDMAKEWEDHEGAAVNRAVAEASERLAAIREAHSEGMDQIEALGGMKPDGGLPDGFVPPKGFHADDFRTVVSWQTKTYPRDPRGTALPPPELTKIHTAVQEAGAAIHADIAAAIGNDPELVRLTEERARAVDRQWDFSLPGGERAAAEADAVELSRKVQAREREFVVDAIAQLRPVGGQKLTNVEPLSRFTVSGLPGGGAGLRPARLDWEAQLAETAAHLPDDWVRRADLTGLQLASTDRAYFQSHGQDWRRGVGGPALMAMNTDRPGRSYRGAFSSYEAEVTYHETGHFMEATIPGLKALQFAYVRSRTTKGGRVEPTVRMVDVAGSSYRSDEVAYKDEFPDLYTGKTYEGDGFDPANEHWEAFQVGLQQVFGRQPGVRYGDETLDHFVVGVLATLGR